MAEIRVYASLPLAKPNTAETVDLNPDNWRWVHCFTFPLEKLKNLHPSQQSFKWIRYAIGAALGAEGELSSSQHSLHSVPALDCNLALPAEKTELFYHYTVESQRHIFPVDPDLARTKVTSTAASEKRDNLHRQAKLRDGSCVVSHSRPEICDAAHLIAHRKGSNYIAYCTRQRSHGAETISDIDDVRNSLLLEKGLHAALGLNLIAFMMTPNFAMTTTDVDNSAQANDSRCTLHSFESDMPLIVSGSAARVSKGSLYPPAYLLDFVYGSTVLHHFGTKNLKDDSPEFFSPVHPGKAAAQRKRQHDEDHDARHHTRDAQDKVLGLPFLYMTREQGLRMIRLATERANAEEARDLEQKIKAWQKQTA